MSLPFRTFTVPIDASSYAQHGIEYTLASAQPASELHFCEVVDPSDAASGIATGAVIDPGPIIEMLERSAEELCRGAADTALQRGFHADGNVLIGRPASEILRFALQSGSEALLICTHARHGLLRVLAGSLTEELLTRSSLPVVVAHAGDQQGHGGPIVVAIDGSRASDRALRVGISIAKSECLALDVIHVVEPHDAWDGAAAVLSAAADIIRNAGVDFELSTLRGPASETIVKNAERRSSPMIVLGTRGHSGLARLALGSVAAGVVEQALVPVTVVREPD